MVILSKGPPAFICYALSLPKVINFGCQMTCVYVKGTNVTVLHTTNSKVFILFPDVCTLSKHFICRLAMNNEEKTVALFSFLLYYHCLYKLLTDIWCQHKKGHSELPWLFLCLQMLLFSLNIRSKFNAHVCVHVHVCAGVCVWKTRVCAEPRSHSQVLPFGSYHAF